MDAGQMFDDHNDQRFNYQPVRVNGWSPTATGRRIRKWQLVHQLQEGHQHGSFRYHGIVSRPGCVMTPV
jgi:hypothetical protein